MTYETRRFNVALAPANQVEQTSTLPKLPKLFEITTQNILTISMAYGTRRFNDLITWAKNPEPESNQPLGPIVILS
jgi:hypothetical protein